MVTSLCKSQATIAVACFLQQLVQMAVWAVMFVITPEVYPTTLRARGLGAANMLDRIGGMIGPFVGGIVLAYNRGIAVMVFASALGIAALSSMLLRTETRGTKLAENLID